MIDKCCVFPQLSDKKKDLKKMCFKEYVFNGLPDFCNEGILKSNGDYNILM